MVEKFKRLNMRSKIQNLTAPLLKSDEGKLDGVRSNVLIPALKCSKPRGYTHHNHPDVDIIQC